LLNFFLINSSENLPPRPNAHEVNRYRAVNGKKEAKVESAVAIKNVLCYEYLNKNAIIIVL
jgi:hypothetical protein